MKNNVIRIDSKIDALMVEYVCVLCRMPNDLLRDKKMKAWGAEIKKARRAKKRLIESTIVRPKPLTPFFTKEETAKLKCNFYINYRRSPDSDI